MNIDKPASLGKVTGQKPPSTQDQSQLSKFSATEHHSKAALQQNIHSSPMACIASSSCISVPHNPPGTVATSLQVPSTVTVTRSIPVSDANNTINMPSCNMNSLPVAVPQKENFKKRSRPADTIAREQRMFSFTKPVVTSHMMNHANTTTSVTSASFQPSADDGTNNSAQTQEHETGLALTKEQIADVIDTTLPTNFSFSLPVAKLPRQKLSVSNKKARKTPGLPLPHPVSKISGTNFNIPASDRVIARKPVPPSCSDSVGSGSAKSGRTARTTDSMKSPSSGRWTRDEHEAFLEGLKIYGREWKKVAQRIPTRTSAQIRSHAQKYFAKLARDERQQAASLSSQASVAMSTTAGLGTSTSAISISAPSMGEIRREYPPSVVERIQKILDDPKGAEREVEETLDRLKRRYNELQRKLELQEQRRIAAQQQQQYHYNQQKSQAQQDQFISFPFSNSAHMKDDSNMITQLKFSDQPQTIVESCNSQGTMKMSPPRPRPCATLPSTSSQQSRLPVTVTSESLAMHSKELIALTVLGGELYRSASQENLRKAADNSETSQSGEGTQCQQSSNKSETDSNNDGSPIHKTN